MKGFGLLGRKILRELWDNQGQSESFTGSSGSVVGSDLNGFEMAGIEVFCCAGSFKDFVVD